MPRHARIDIPGLLQHVIVRGIERRDIFLVDNDREDFIERLFALLEETATVCYAWALLDNHFHLLLMPTKTTLAALMRRLLTGYAVAFNLRHQRSGHLFQNRYKSIVCNSDAYLHELVRYIHLNPVRAGKVSDLNALAEYPWSGHRQMVGKGKYFIVREEDIVSLFTSQTSSAREAYLQFLADGLDKDAPQLSRGGRRASQSIDSSLADQDLYDDRILGGGSFVERFMEEEVPQEGKERSFAEIMDAVANYYNFKVEELSWPGKVHKISNAKAVICFLATRRHRITGNEVGKKLGYTASAVSRAAQRGQKIFYADENLKHLM